MEVIRFCGDHTVQEETGVALLSQRGVVYSHLSPVDGEGRLFADSTARASAARHSKGYTGGAA